MTTTAPPNASKLRADEKLLFSATPAEKQLLAMMLREVRHVMATKEQLSIGVDPFRCQEGGAYVHFAYNGSGTAFEVEDGLRSRRKKTR